MALEDHIKYVREAGRKLGVPNYQLIEHDQSKYSKFEFDQYTNYFYNEDGSKKTPDQRTSLDIDNFAEAWLHHMNHNKHHWQYWIFPDGFSHGTFTINGVMKMRENFALEMIADWMGASMAYTQSWDMDEWLLNNISTVTLHPETVVFVKDKLTSLGYSGIVGARKFKNE